MKKIMNKYTAKWENKKELWSSEQDIKDIIMEEINESLGFAIFEETQEMDNIIEEQQELAKNNKNSKLEYYEDTEEFTQKNWDALYAIFKKAYIDYNKKEVFKYEKIEVVDIVDYLKDMGFKLREEVKRTPKKFYFTNTNEKFYVTEAKDLDTFEKHIEKPYLGYVYEVIVYEDKYVTKQDADKIIEGYRNK